MVTTAARHTVQVPSVTSPAARAVGTQEPDSRYALRAARAQAAAREYDAEVALHSAHQSRIDAWVSAAADKLHAAVLELARADAALDHPWQ